ncbi:MAG: MarR family winged helix-turn-helix transcriptional regulator [Anaerolineae bacterium]
MTSFDPRHRKETPGGQAAIAFYRISQAIGHLLRARGKTHRLSPAQMQTLLFLEFARPGVCTIGGVANRLAVSYATASGVVDALERKQLVERRPFPADRRTITLSLTEEGSQEAARLEDLLDEVETAVNTLPAAEQQALVRAAQAIVRQLHTAGYVQVYEMCWGCHFFQQDAHPDDPHGPHHCAFMDAPLPEPQTYLECPDFVPAEQ